MAELAFNLRLRDGEVKTEVLINVGLQGLLPSLQVKAHQKRMRTLQELVSLDHKFEMQNYVDRQQDSARKENTLTRLEK